MDFLDFRLQGFEQLLEDGSWFLADSEVGEKSVYLAGAEPDDLLLNL